MRLPQKYVAAVLVICINFSGLTTCTAEPAPADKTVGATIKELEQWLGNNANAQRWQAYLHLDSLKAELAKDQPEASVVIATLDQLGTQVPGLESPKFVRLREAASSWLEELTLPSGADLPEAIREAAKASYTPPGDDEVVQARKELAAAVARLDQYLARGGANGAAWKTYLKWDVITAELQPEAKPDLDALKASYKRFATDKPGLELPVYMVAGDALKRYLDAVEARQTADADTYKKQLELLVADIGALGKERERAIEVGRRLGWLEKIRQARPLARAVRHRLSTPNLYVEATDDIVGAGIARKIDEPIAIRDNILGTDISGTGHTVGHLYVELVPDRRHATLDTMLVGKTRTNTVGYNGPATIYSTGTTQVAGRKRIVIDATGLKSYPATAAAITNTQINGVAAGRGGLIQRIASKKVGESKGQAEQIAARRAEQRVRDRTEVEARKNLLQADTRFQDKFRKPLLRRREFPQVLNFSTTRELLQIVALQADAVQLGAPSDPLPLDPGHALSVRVHESMINNSAAAFLAGETIRQEGVRKWAEGLPEPNRTETLKRMDQDADQGNWGITFADLKPITIFFDDGGFVITIRGKNFLRDDESFNRAMNITARYKFEMAGKGTRLVRQGDLEIVPPKRNGQDATLSVADIGLQKKLLRRMERVFEPVIENKDIIENGLLLPGQWKNAGRLALKQLNSKDGWLVYGWVKAADVKVAQKPAAPAAPAAVE